ncbi:MAG: Nif3-like dinuclear metal center hexameric protein [Clostridiales bacterium]|nr:Nif3-like dinuclear metal center hexameric protein [Clostridiales bacterium]
MAECKVSDVCSIMQDIAPTEYAEDFDNVGLLVGDKNSPVTGIVVALDATLDVINFAISNECNMILTHHPLIFTPLKKVVRDDAVGSVVLQCIKNGISVYSAHTNFDKVQGGTDDALAAALDIISPKRLDDEIINGVNVGLGRYGTIERITVKELADKLSQRLCTTVVTTADDNKIIHTVASVAGSGGDFVEHAIAKNADIFITGEMNYHSALDAKRLGLDVMLCSHAASEQISLNSLKNTLQNRINGVQYSVRVILAPYHNLWH